MPAGLSFTDSLVEAHEFYWESKTCGTRERITQDFKPSLCIWFAFQSEVNQTKCVRLRVGLQEAWLSDRETIAQVAQSFDERWHVLKWNVFFVCFQTVERDFQ